MFTVYSINHPCARIFFFKRSTIQVCLDWVVVRKFGWSMFGIFALAKKLVGQAEEKSLFYRL
jgi:hypothetical protein